MTTSRAPDSGYHERAMTHGTNIIETHREGVMSTREDVRADQVGTSEGIGRRTVIGRSLGVALAGSVLGATGLSAAAAGAEQSSAGGSGIALPQGMRRVVTGHDAEGKSYIVSDERVTMGPFPNLFKTTGDDPFGPGPESLPRARCSPRIHLGSSLRWVAPVSCSSRCPQRAPMPSCVGTGPRRSTSTWCWGVS